MHNKLLRFFAFEIFVVIGCAHAITPDGIWLSVRRTTEHMHFGPVLGRMGTILPVTNMALAVQTVLFSCYLSIDRV